MPSIRRGTDRPAWSRAAARGSHADRRGLFWLALLDPGQFVMERKMLLGIKERAEARASRLARRKRPARPKEKIARR